MIYGEEGKYLLKKEKISLCQMDIYLWKHLVKKMKMYMKYLKK